MTTLISPQDTWTLWAVILGGVAGSIYLEQTFKWAAKLSGPVLALLMAMVLSNLKVMPTEAPAYDLIWKYFVPVAIPLLLFRANVFRIIKTCGRMFLAFHLSAAGTMIGAVLATLLLRDSVERAPHVAAILTGSYIGGSVNFFALKEAFQVPEQITNPLLVADNFVMAGAFIVLLMLAGSRLMRRYYPHPHSVEEGTKESQALAAEHWKRKEISLLDIAKALAVAFVITAVAQKLAGWMKARISVEMIAAIIANPYVVVTFLSVAVATVFHRSIQRIQGADELGGYLLYVFLFAIGLPADLWQVVVNVPMMFVFCFIVAVMNLVVTLGVGKLLRLNLEELLLCVNASLGGPPTAAAMAIAKGWPKLVLPGLLAGIWGYAIGTFLGIVVGEMLLRLLR